MRSNTILSHLVMGFLSTTTVQAGSKSFEEKENQAGQHLLSVTAHSLTITSTPLLTPKYPSAQLLISPKDNRLGIMLPQDPRCLVPSCSG